MGLIHIHSSFCVLNLLLSTSGPNFSKFAVPHERLSGPALGCLVSKLTCVSQGIQLRMKGHLEILYCMDAVCCFCKALDCPGPWQHLNMDRNKEMKFKTKRKSVLDSDLMVNNFVKLASRQ